VSPAGAGAIQRLCVACVGLLDVTGAGVSVMSGEGNDGAMGASGELAARVEEWQFSLGEGPCREAFFTDQPIMVDDLNADTDGHVARWPVFGAAAQQAGIRAIFAFPLRIGNKPIGVLDLFRDRVGVLSSEQLGVARAVAELAGSLLRPDGPESEDEDMVFDETAYRHEVHQATGMLSVQLGVSTQEALVRLRARAFADGRRVTELAADVVGRRMRFAEDEL
jgi:GAF domain/ANTAR domain